MSNNIDSVIEEYWAKVLQLEHSKFNVYKYITDFQLEATLRTGDKFHKSYFDAEDEELAEYTVGSDIAVEDVTTTDEELTVNRKYAQAREFDKFQDVQTAMSVADQVAPKDAQRMANKMDYDALAEIANAASIVDSGVLGTGTADGVGIEPDTTNVVEIFSNADRFFDEKNISSIDRKAVLCPRLAQVVKEYLAGRDTPLGDKRVTDGNLNTRFMGYELFVSNQILSTALLNLAGAPDDANTITIDGVVLTAVTVIGVTPGNFLIGSADVTRANLAGLINNPGTTNANQVGFGATTSSYKKLKNRATAVNDNSANTLTLSYSGRSNLAVSATLTGAAAADGWDATKTCANNFFCADKPVSMVRQILPMVEVTPAQLRFSRYVKRGMFYGLKTWRENTFKMVNVKTKV